MSFLILVRHGQSIWNLENKFTGWVDVDLTEQGKLEAEKAGKIILKMVFAGNVVETSAAARRPASRGRR